jgi:hypothetical protein
MENLGKRADETEKMKSSVETTKDNASDAKKTTDSSKCRRRGED